MNGDDFNSELKRYYERVSVSDECKRDILQMRGVMGEVRRWRRMAISMAGCALLALGIAGYPLIQGDGTLAEWPFKKSVIPDELREFDLVAVKVNHDDCYQCKKMGNVFAEVQKDLEGKRVLFLTFDVTNSTRKRQSLLLVQALGISRVIQPDEKTGMVVLIDDEGKMLERLDGTSGRKALVDSIAMRLARR